MGSEAPTGVWGLGGHAVAPKGKPPRRSPPLKCVLFTLDCLVRATAERRSWLGGNPWVFLTPSSIRVMLSSAGSGAPHPVIGATWQAASPGSAQSTWAAFTGWEVLVTATW